MPLLPPPSYEPPRPPGSPRETPPAPGGAPTPSGPASPGALGALTPGAGDGMDRRLVPRRWTPRRLTLIAGGLLAAGLVAYGLLTRDGRRRLTVEPDRLTVSTVQRGDFEEYVALTGTVRPERTVYLDAVVGGQVQERLVEEGDFVAAGQPLLVLTNDNLTLQMMASEAQMQEQISTLRSQRLALDQNQLNLSQQVVQLDYEVRRLRRERDRTASLVSRGLVPQQDFDAVRDEHDYTVRRRSLTQQGFRQDSLSRAIQLAQMAGTMDRLHRNLGLVQRTMSNLVVKASVAGQLTALNAEVGELKAPGARLGQVDVLDGYRVRVPIDEHYLARVAAGQTARATVEGRDYGLVVATVYPEVRDGRFEVDMAFAEAAPASIRRGQSLRLRLELGDPERALLLARGGFFGATGGNWAYVLTPDSALAVRRPIRLGRQNPQFYEVTEGLRVGDRVVTSPYDTFGEAEVLVLR